MLAAGAPADGNDRWSSGTHKQFGGTIQFLTTPAGTLGGDLATSNRARRAT